MVETSVGVRDLKTHLSEYLRELRKGKIIIITDHGRTVGRLIPAESSLATRMDAVRLSGLVRWSGKKLSLMKPIAKMHGTRKISDLISEDRE
jgi:prevent-host-death family protein